jgi:hypothetical protein
MELICTDCFTHPLGADSEPARVPNEMLVCSLGAPALSRSTPAYEALRCSYCGSAVHLDHHHSAWYDK